MNSLRKDDARRPHGEAWDKEDEAWTYSRALPAYPATPTSTSMPLPPAWRSTPPDARSMLGVYKVYSVLSGDLSVPVSVQTR